MYSAISSDDSLGSAPELVDLRQKLKDFLSTCSEPAVLEPGEAIFPLRAGEYSLEEQGSGWVLEAWGGSKLLRRRLKRVSRAAKGRLELIVERFPRRTGKLTLVDTQAESAPAVERDASRGEALAQLRGWCERLFPQWRLEQISCGADLENSLSPRFPRAFLRFGSRAMALLSVPNADAADEALAFGLIWLEYVRSRASSSQSLELVLFVPKESEIAMGLRLRALDPGLVRIRMFVSEVDGFPEERPEQSWGNLDSAVTASIDRVPPDENTRLAFLEVAAQSDAEVVEDLQGALHLEVRGIPIAACRGDDVRVGLSLRSTRKGASVQSLLQLARRVASIRCADSPQPQHDLYRSFPERWLEGIVRSHITKIDPMIDPQSVRRQVSGFLGLHHSRTDLLALDRNGCLLVIEIKVQEDIALPIQALDYYTRYRLHLCRGQIQASSLYPNRVLRDVPPRLLLVAPALCFHPTNETVLRYFESSISVRQIGVAIEWRKKLRVLFDHGRGWSQRGGTSEWQAISSVKSERPFPP